jgi:hypothetical protein
MSAAVPQRGRAAGVLACRRWTPVILLCWSAEPDGSRRPALPVTNLRARIRWFAQALADLHHLRLDAGHGRARILAVDRDVLQLLLHDRLANHLAERLAELARPEQGVPLLDRLDQVGERGLRVQNRSLVIAG